MPRCAVLDRWVAAVRERDNQRGLAAQSPMIKRDFSRAQAPATPSVQGVPRHARGPGRVLKLLLNHSAMSDRIARLEREVVALRALVRATPTSRLAEQLVAEAMHAVEEAPTCAQEALPACHSDKTSTLSSKQLSERFTRAVLALTEEF